MFARSLVSPAFALILEQRARAMRFAPTPSEALLWRHLSGSKTRFAFRRQLVIARYIVDFACTKVRLAVEVDGPSHENRERHDASRDRNLSELGWYVARFTEEEVLLATQAVLSSVRRITLARLR